MKALITNYAYECCECGSQMLTIPNQKGDLHLQHMESTCLYSNQKFNLPIFTLEAHSEILGDLANKISGS